MLVTTKEILAKAQERKYAVAAFNIYNMETVQAAVYAAKNENKAVILALGERYFHYADIEGLTAFMKTTANKIDTPIALHLDHAYQKETVIKAIKNGFSSVMYDGSKYSLEENIKKTKEICELAHDFGVAVEAEIGSIQKGEFSDEEEGTGQLTDPQSAKEFVENTQVDFLAAAIGTVHGMYKGEPNINLSLLEEIQQQIHIPLVLHGGSGTPDHIIRQTIERGICKINVNTEISLTAINTLRDTITNETPHLSTVMEKAQTEMETTMTQFIRLFSNQNSYLAEVKIGQH